MLWTMGRGSRLEVASQSASPSGPASSDVRVVDLSGDRVSARLDGVLAIIDGSDAVAAAVHGVLVAAFQRGELSDGLRPGEEKPYVAEALRDAIASAEKEPVSIALVAYRKERVIAGAAGGAQIYRSDDGAIRELLAGDSPGESNLSVTEAQLLGGQSLVLVGAEVTRHVSDKELRQTVQASFSHEDAAAWLVTLAASRSGHTATALLAQRLAGKTQKRDVFAPAPKTRRRMPGMSVPRAGAIAAAIAVIVIAALATGTLVKLVGSAGSASALQSPTGLTVVSNSVTSGSGASVQLQWNATAGSNYYVVSVDGRRYRTTAPNLQLSGTLTPGRQYAWRVAAVYGSTKRPSRWAQLTVASEPALPHAIPLTPGPVVTVAANQNVSFCWTANANASGFHLYIGGGPTRIRRFISRTATRPMRPFGRCVDQFLAPGHHYGWRLGTLTPLHAESWTPWHHLFVQSSSGTPTPAATATTPATVATAPPASTAVVP